MKWLIGALIVAVFAGGITWAVISQNRWDDRCHRAGGTVETRFEGFITVLIGSPPQPYLQPQYSDHCWVDGREVNP